MAAAVKRAETSLKSFYVEFAVLQVLPRRLDWEGREHAQSYDELVSLADVCAQNFVYLRFANCLATRNTEIVRKRQKILYCVMH